MEKKLKLYLDASFISHLCDAEDSPNKMADTNELWKDAIGGKYELFISPVVMEELERCHQPKRSKMYRYLEQTRIEVLPESGEIVELSKEYIKKGVLTEKSLDDCLHIAFAVVHDCDIIVSWNFKHLVNYRTIDKVKVVNAINHYREISIVSPTMLIERNEL